MRPVHRFQRRENQQLNPKQIKTTFAVYSPRTVHGNANLLTIIPQALMGSESIAHEAEGRIGY